MDDPKAQDIETLLQFIGFDDNEVEQVGEELKIELGLRAFTNYDKKLARGSATDLKKNPATSRVLVGSKSTKQI